MKIRSLLLFLSCCVLPLVPARAQTDQIIYDDALENGWQDYGYATLNYSNTNPVHTGSDSISVSAKAFEALYLHRDVLDTTNLASLTFWINGGAAGGQSLQVLATLDGATQPAVPIPAPTANTWTQVTVTLAALGVQGKAGFDGIYIQNATGNTLPTFYVDDISLVANPPPATIQLAADAGSVVRTIDARIFGVNTAIYDDQLGSDATRTLVSQGGFKALRGPGGSLSDQYDWSTDRDVTDNTLWPSPFPVFATLAAAVGAEAYISVNYGSGTPEEAAAWVAYANGDPASTAAIGTDVKGRDWQTVGHWASLRAASPLAADDGQNFLRIGQSAPFGCKYWEVGNECFFTSEFDQHGTVLPGAPADPFTYAQNFALFKQKMLAVDPTILLGAVVTTDPDSFGNGTHPVVNPRDGTTHTGWTSVLLANLKTLGALPDYITEHDYPQQGGAESDTNLLALSATLAAKDSAAMRQMLSDYVGDAGAGIELALGETNCVGDNPGKESTSLVNGLHLAELVGGLAATEFNNCMWWDLRNASEDGNNDDPLLYGYRLFGDDGLVAAGDRADTPLNTPYPVFRAYELLSKWAAGGDQTVAATTNYAVLTVHAALRASGDLCLLVINKSPTDALTAQIALSNFVPSASTATVYQFGKTEDTNNTDLTTTTLSGVGANFSATLPSYSMTVIDLAGTAPSHPAFFAGETALDDGVYYLDFPNGNYFGYYSYLSDPHYIYHFDLGYEYWFDAGDGMSGIYFYDFASSDFFYTSPTFPFPYLYDFGLNTVLYYYPDPGNAGRYNTDGVRYFYDFATGQIITK